jgi:Xaa-Pro aminopeptidase
MGLKKRLISLQQKITKEQWQGVLITEFSDLYYLTGKHMSAGKLLVLQDKSFLLVDARYIEECRKVEHLDVLLEEDDTLCNILNSETKEGVIVFDSQSVTYKKFLSFEKKIAPCVHLTLKPWDSPLSSSRMIKDRDELKKLKAAAELGSRGFDFVCHSLKEGVTEQELACQLQEFWWNNHSQGASFDPIIAFGENSSMPHYHVRSVALQKNQAVLIDLGVKLDSYCSDMTRTVFFGDVSDKILEIYSVVQAAQQAAIDKCVPGISLYALDAVARDYIRSKGYGEYFGHSLGHGIGLDIHEGISIGPKSSKEEFLKEGMVITIEPGIYLPNEGGVRIEDTVIVTATGCEIITCRSKELTFFA